MSLKLLRRNQKPSGDAPDPVAVFNALSDVLVVLDGADRILSVNAAAEQFFSTGMSARAGQSLHDLLPDDSPIFGVIRQARIGGVEAGQRAVDHLGPVGAHDGVHIKRTGRVRMHQVQAVAARGKNQPHGRRRVARQALARFQVLDPLDLGPGHDQHAQRTGARWWHGLGRRRVARLRQRAAGARHPAGGRS